MPETFLGKVVMDGDKSDLKNLYSKNMIIGLKLKGGKAIQASTSPFIVDNPECITTSQNTCNTHDLATAGRAYAIAAE
jgi:hypothetical protein